MTNPSDETAMNVPLPPTPFLSRTSGHLGKNGAYRMRGGLEPLNTLATPQRDPNPNSLISKCISAAYAGCPAKALHGRRCRQNLNLAGLLKPPRYEGGIDIHRRSKCVACRVPGNTAASCVGSLMRCRVLEGLSSYYFVLLCSCSSIFPSLHQDLKRFSLGVPFCRGLDRVYSFP